MLAHTKKFKTDELDCLPEGKLGRKITKTAFGILLVGLGFLFIAKAWMPWPVGLSVAGFGGFCISQDMMVKAGKGFVAMLRDIFDAIKGASHKTGGQDA